MADHQLHQAHPQGDAHNSNIKGHSLSLSLWVQRIMSLTNTAGDKPDEYLEQFFLVGQRLIDRCLHGVYSTLKVGEVKSAANLYGQ